MAGMNIDEVYETEKILLLTMEVKINKVRDLRCYLVYWLFVNWFSPANDFTVSSLRENI